MKLNSKIVAALLLCVVAAITVGMVAAEDLTLPDGATFTVPDGFTVQEDDEGNTVLVKDNVAIVVLASDAKSPDDAKKTLESKGYTFKNQRDLSNFKNINVVEQSYDKDGMPVYGYICEVDGIQYIVSVANPPADWEITDGNNPANVLISSIDTSNVQTE